MVTYSNLWKYNIITFVLAVILALTVVYVKGADTEKFMMSNSEVFATYPSDGTAFNEIHRYYGSCSVFGDVAQICYHEAYTLAGKEDTMKSLEIKYFALSGGQYDICNMMFNKGTYDQFMGVDPVEMFLISNRFGHICQISLDNITEKEFNESYGTKDKDK